jgi:putative transposase
VRGEWSVSIRRVCRVLQVDTSTYHYKSRRPGQAVLEKRIKEICQTRERYGYRRVSALLRREGWRISVKRCAGCIVSKACKLRNKSPKRRVKAKLRAGRSPATAANQAWAMDFVHDRLFDGRKI